MHGKPIVVGFGIVLVKIGRNVVTIRKFGFGFVVSYNEDSWKIIMCVKAWCDFYY